MEEVVEEGQGKGKERVYPAADELEGLRADLLRLSSSLGAQRAARSRAEGKVRQCEAKVEKLLAREGQEEREEWERANLEMARQKVQERLEKANVEQLERLVQRLEDWVGWGRKVKEEEVEDEVEEVGEEKVGERVQEEVEENVVEEKVVVGGGWLTGFLGSRVAGAIMDFPREPAVLAGHHPPNLDHPLLLSSESPIWTLRFVMHRVHHKILGQGRWVWADAGGVHKDKPVRLGVGVLGELWWQPEMPGGRRANRAPFPTRG